MSIRKRALSVLLTIAVMITFMPFVTMEVNAASKSPVQVVTKAKSNNGNTTYTYNKKGLVTKAVTKSFRNKTSVWDDEISADYANYAYTTTTTYKYNKKNKVTKKVTTDVTKATYYKADKTTGKSLVANLGTVTTTNKGTTVYTYNKKGLATKAVKTSVITKSGSTTVTTNSRTKGSGSNEIDGKLVYTYNDYGADGKCYLDEDRYTKSTASNVVYYSGDIDKAVNNGTTTTTYVPTSNGYNVVTEYASNSNGSYRVEPTSISVYFKGEWGKDATPVTVDDDWDFSETITTEAKVVPSNGTARTSYSWRDESANENKTTTTTVYKYDKKKRVKSAASTTVKANSSTSSNGEEVIATMSWSDGSSETDINNSKVTYSSTDTSNKTTSYTYDKKGRAKKKVASENGVENSTSTYAYGLPNYSTERIAADGTKTTYSEVGSGAEFASVSNTVVQNGTKTSTRTYYEYTVTENSNGEQYTYPANKDRKPEVNTEPVKATPKKYVYAYTYDKDGNLKKTKVTETSTRWAVVKDETYGNTIGEFDANGEYQDKEITVTTTTSYNSTLETAVKKGTKRLNKALEMLNNYKTDGAYSSGYYLDSRVVYTLKAKKLSSALAKIAEQQQWIIQNGELNGQIGLF